MNNEGVRQANTRPGQTTGEHSKSWATTWMVIPVRLLSSASSSTIECWLVISKFCYGSSKISSSGLLTKACAQCTLMLTSWYREYDCALCINPTRSRMSSTACLSAWELGRKLTRTANTRKNKTKNSNIAFINKCVILRTNTRIFLPGAAERADIPDDKRNNTQLSR